jgi:ubiquinone/menaquinone biosynthesis C-methylase UbiE
MRSAFLLLAALLLPACADAPQEHNVNPGINEGFLDPELNPAAWTKRFEGESREVFALRSQITAAMGIQPGMTVADVGSGTGMMLPPLAKATGSNGTVYAVDISPRLIEHLELRAETERLSQVEVVLCTDRSAKLQKNSTDRVVIIDTYHHFEYPHSTMKSIHEALRKDGEVLIVDFIRIPGVSEDWILKHVRAGKEVVLAELEEAGFELLEEKTIPGLKDNYVLRMGKN